MSKSSEINSTLTIQQKEQLMLFGFYYLPVVKNRIAFEIMSFSKPLFSSFLN